ncbi:MAG TPA: patatin-like phospholipase family protein, partial [Thermodesulfobacteriota bacterium]|nr:patatin-like phospholipase family protein [Thermodesulfobacteriota bacterium]
MNNKIKIGLTFYGGVSLAVYEAGVAEEFIRFVQFCRTRGKTYLQRTNTEVDIGVLSGSSAGGLASVMMSATLVNSQDPLRHIENMRRIWFDVADISNLRYQDKRNIRSFLDNDILEREIQDFLQLWDRSAEGLAGKDLKMMLTGTNMQGLFDAIPIEEDFVPPDSFADKVFTTLRNTEVFEFSGAKIVEARESFGRVIRGRIAKTARITSSFPAAFPPQFASSPGFPDETLENLKDSLSFWYFDGGVLDNKPLGHAIDHMESTDEEGLWWFCFVDPDPEKDQAKHPEWGNNPQKPPDPATTLSTVLEVRGAETIYYDLRRIQKINHQVMQLNDLILLLWKHLCPARVPPSQIKKLLEDLERIVITARIHRFLPDYLRCLTMLRNCFKDLSDELGEKQEWVIKAVKPFDLKKMVSECRARITAGLMLENLSAENRKGLSEKGREIEESPAMKAYQEAIERVKEKQLFFREITFWVENDYVERKQLSRETRESFDKAWHNFKKSMDLLIQAYDAVIGEIQRIVRDPEQLTAVICFLRINEALRAASGIETRQKIKVVKLYHNKKDYGSLAGACLGHFGGFLDEGWRKNDYLMGIRDTQEMLKGKMDRSVFSPDFWTEYERWHDQEDRRIQEKYRLSDKDVLSSEAK